MWLSQRAAGRPAAAVPRAPAASPRHRAVISIPNASPAPAHDPFVEATQGLELNPHWPAPNNL